MSREGSATATQPSRRPSWGELQRLAEVELADRREARWLVESVAGGRVPLAGTPTDDQRSLVHELITRRRAGEPLQYVVGSWQFRGLELLVDRRVLIPRPETEQVVEVALGHLHRLAEMTHQTSRSGPALEGVAPVLEVVDLGVGSGAIALSMAAEWPCTTSLHAGSGTSSRPEVDVEVWGVDRSADALDVAATNRDRLGERFASRVRLLRGDWWQALPSHLEGRISLAVSNPPYISSSEMAGIEPVVKDWEPTEALEAGPTGTEAHRTILRDAPRWLHPGGIVVLEIAPHQAEEVAESASQAGLVQIEVYPDLAGRPRTVVARAR